MFYIISKKSTIYGHKNNYMTLYLYYFEVYSVEKLSASKEMFQKST